MSPRREAPRSCFVTATQALALQPVVVLAGPGCGQPPEARGHGRSPRRQQRAALPTPQAALPAGLQMAAGATGGFGPGRLLAGPRRVLSTV